MSLCTSCNAKIAWIVTAKGKRAPVNLPAIRMVEGDGQVAAFDAGGFVRRGRLAANDDDAKVAITARISHFATCPASAEHRKPAEPPGDRHKCAARDCRVLVPTRMLMCLPHWGRVPRDLARRIRETYRPGQEKIGVAAASPEYLRAVDEAVEAVANHLAEREDDGEG